MNWIYRLAPYLLFVFYRCLMMTWRIRIHESPGLKELLQQKKVFVIAHWHGEELGIIHLLGRYRVGCMISTSKDGELIAKVAELFGARVVRGSSTRGAVTALKGILRLGKEGWRPSVAVDGPRGPLHEVKPGVTEIAKILKAPVLSISMASSRPIIFQKSWNKSELPGPFSRLDVFWGAPLHFDFSSETVFETAAQQIKSSLQEGRTRALRSTGRLQD